MGRQYIGRKAQAAVPDEYSDLVLAEAARRGVPEADIWREVIEAGMASWSARLDERVKVDA